MTNPTSFDHIMDWKQTFLTKGQPQDINTFPFLVIGNKIDMEQNRKVSFIDARKFCQQNGNMIFHECSAMTGQNIETAFKELGERAVKRQAAMTN